MRLNRPLLALGLVATAGALVLFTLTHFTLLSGMLAALGFAFFLARQLVQKSIALTASSPENAPGTLSDSLGQIRRQVSKAKFLENLENEGTRVAHQAELLVQQHKNLIDALARKLSPTELTYERYLNAIDVASLAIGENLLHAKNTLENLNLTPRNSLTPAQLAPVNELLASIDQALKQLADLFHSINEMNTQEKHRDQLEDSLERIRELADRAKIYSKK